VGGWDCANARAAASEKTPAAAKACKHMDIGRVFVILNSIALDELTSQSGLSAASGFIDSTKSHHGFEIHFVLRFTVCYSGQPKKLKHFKL
jgi:hypothetical protein